jgi:hypothetical protein
MNAARSMTRAVAKEMALALWDMGYEIFPLPPGCKTTAGSGIRWRAEWEENQFTTREQVADYWTRHPDANIGVECGKSNLLVIDLDGVEAAEAFARLWRESEGTADYGTLTVKTRRGWHLWFTAPSAEPFLRNTESMLLPGVDTRGEGGMVVAPGSTVRYDSDGNLVSPYTYELISGDLAHPPPRALPGWLEQRLRACQPRTTHAEPVAPWTEPFAKIMLAEVPRRVAAAPSGRSNRVLNREAWRMRAALDALGYDQIEEALLIAAEQNGLAHEEPTKTLATIRSGLGR